MAMEVGLDEDRFDGVLRDFLNPVTPSTDLTDPIGSTASFEIALVVAWGSGAAKEPKGRITRPKTFGLCRLARYCASSSAVTASPTAECIQDAHFVPHLLGGRFRPSELTKCCLPTTALPFHHFGQCVRSRERSSTSSSDSSGACCRIASLTEATERPDSQVNGTSLMVPPHTRFGCLWTTRINNSCNPLTKIRYSAPTRNIFRHVAAADGVPGKRLGASKERLHTEAAVEAS
jgi:hypothetical protein